MPINATAPINLYTGNGSTTAFTYNFKILEVADIKVYFDGILQSSGFVVTGTGSDTGGTVTFTSAPLNSIVVRLERITTIDRSTDYVEGGGLASATLDADLDRLAGISQEIDNRTLQEVSDGTFDAESKRIKNIADPVNGSDAANRDYVINQSAASVTSAAASAASAAADVILTNADVVTTSADVVITNADVVATNADVVTTEANKIAAQLAEANAAASYDNFDDRYLGAKAADPVLDNDGQALIDGALYWNNVDKVMRVYDLATDWYLANSNSSAADVANVPAGNIVATNVQAAINELDSEKAAIAGDAAQTFSVAIATTAAHAVQKSQLDLKAEKTGDSAQAFLVASATLSGHALKYGDFNSVLAGIGLNGLGWPALLKFKVNPSNIYSGAVVAGSSLYYAATSGFHNAISPSGSWKLVGEADGSNDTSLFVKVAN